MVYIFSRRKKENPDTARYCVYVYIFSTHLLCVTPRHRDMINAVNLGTFREWYDICQEKRKTVAPKM